MFERCIARTKLKLIRAKETADATAQLLFQLERVFFYAFGQDISKTMYYAAEGIAKSIDRNPVENLVVVRRLWGLCVRESHEDTDTNLRRQSTTGGGESEL
jgi:hypothetical protein